MGSIGKLLYGFTVTTWLVLVCGVPFALYYSHQETKEYRNDCEAKGGQVLEARGMRACIDPKALK